MIQNDFKFREEFNRMYVLMQTSGIVQRAHSHYKKKELKKNYETKEYYQVELEGVLFEHVQLIILGYFMVFPIVLVILFIEIIHQKMSLKKSTIIEIDSVHLNLDEQHDDLNRSVEAFNAIIVDEDDTDDLIMEFVEYLEVINFD